MQDGQNLDWTGLDWTGKRGEGMYGKPNGVLHLYHVGQKICTVLFLQ